MWSWKKLGREGGERAREKKEVKESWERKRTIQWEKSDMVESSRVSAISPPPISADGCECKTLSASIWGYQQSGKKERGGGREKGRQALGLRGKLMSVCKTPSPLVSQLSTLLFLKLPMVLHSGSDTMSSITLWCVWWSSRTLFIWKCLLTKTLIAWWLKVERFLLFGQSELEELKIDEQSMVNSCFRV